MSFSLNSWSLFLSFLKSVFLGICLTEDRRCLLILHKRVEFIISTLHICSLIKLWWAFSTNSQNSWPFFSHLSYWKIHISFLTHSIFYCNSENRNSLLSTDYAFSGQCYSNKWNIPWWFLFLFIITGFIKISSAEKKIFLMT